MSPSLKAQNEFLGEVCYMRIIFSTTVEVWDFQILYFGLKIILHKYEKYHANFRWPFQR